MTILAEGTDGRRLWWCPGCECAHFLDGRWLVREGERGISVSPSVYVRGTKVCHALIRHGQIEYLRDCTHALAGQTVPMVDWEGV